MLELLSIPDIELRGHGNLPLRLFGRGVFLELMPMIAASRPASDEGFESVGRPARSFQDHLKGTAGGMERFDSTDSTKSLGLRARAKAKLFSGNSKSREKRRPSDLYGEAEIRHDLTAANSQLFTETSTKVCAQTTPVSLSPAAHAIGVRINEGEALERNRG